jgi:alkanesulfonate monooxygenase SsuD/methylene tetrahydromethanopterin reductase-like flavin-dependent oxidoreductase (luciferase family)
LASNDVIVASEGGVGNAISDLRYDVPSRNIVYTNNAEAMRRPDSGRGDDVKIGVQFPNESFVGSATEIRDFVQTAEEVGFAHLVIYEHVLGVEHSDRTPPLIIHYDKSTVFHEPLVLGGYIAGVTNSTEIETGVVVLPQRQTALVAKQAAEVSFLSNARLRLGVGVGWNYVEYEGMGVDIAEPRAVKRCAVRASCHLGRSAISELGLS